MKKRRGAVIIAAALIFTVLVTGSKCDGKPDDYESHANEEAAQAIRLGFSSVMSDEEKAQLQADLEDMTAEEFNEAVGGEMDRLSQEENQEFLEWLKSYHLVSDGCEEGSWQLPVDFAVSGSLDWPESIPKPEQGTVVKTEQGEDVTRVEIKNVTKKTFENWKAKLDENWSLGCAVLEAVNENMDKAKQYVEGNTKYNLGEETQTTTEMFESEGREISQSVIFTDDHMTKWLQLDYGNNMAVIAYTNNFTANAAQEKTAVQKSNEAMISKVGAVSFPGPSEAQFTKYTEIGETKSGNIGQVMVFEGGNDSSAFSWQERMVDDGWNVKIIDEDENFMEYEMRDIDSSADFVPDTQGFVTKTTESHYEKQVGNTVYRMQVLTVETSYSLGDEIDVNSENYKRVVIVTINGIDVVEAASWNN